MTFQYAVFLVVACPNKNLKDMYTSDDQIILARIVKFNNGSGKGAQLTVNLFIYLFNNNEIQRTTVH